MQRFLMMMAAGLAAGLGQTAIAGDAGALDSRTAPEIAPRGTVATRHVAHIYFNIATGERVATLIGGTRPADGGASPEVWVSDNEIPCAGFGQTHGIAGALDSPACTTCLPSTAIGVTYLDWGDIRRDTVVDCVGVSWGGRVADTDTDQDGMGDGVEGYAATWTWFDADDGFDSGLTRLPLAALTLTNLPGDYNESRNNLAVVYTATVDLGGGDSTSGLTFEIGDSDSSSPADFFNPGIGDTSDLDSDGKADFSYALRYTQPGTYDFDNADGDDDPTTGVDGDPDNQGPTLWPLAVGNGDVSTDGSAYTPGTAAPDAVGIEDAFDFFIDTDRDGMLELVGSFWYGGFHCDLDGNGAWEQGVNENPWAQFRMILYGPSEDLPCSIDYAPPYGVINFFDVNAFVLYFQLMDDRADISPPFGSWDFFDFVEFIRLLNEGCP